ncbi:DUF1801 domain-containing protein [uncultured Aquimarina sp.]|uniref:DUF1801 domain-containing protein n=1 Tax=uncultured Aquimarina sp. TaxID=575652 RepID=UPI0026308471|nr:DUF1801 domain-containing protein [uncultured Aquimarina sp.]
MSKLNIKTNPKVESVYQNYTDPVRKKIMNLRNLIIEIAETTEGITSIEETLKWGEPSFLTKKGSTIRIDWKKGKPNQYAMYFQCTSKLVTTFRVLYKDTFRFEGNRAIIFPIDSRIPKKELKNCITAALTYHKVKHLPTLGI